MHALINLLSSSKSLEKRVESKRFAQLQTAFFW